MTKRIDTDQVVEQSRSITAEYYRELFHREFVSSGQQLRSVLAALNKNKPYAVGAGETLHV